MTLLGGWHRGCFVGVVMSTTVETSNATATAARRVISTGTAKSHFDSAVSLIETIGENETCLYWQGERNRVLSAFGSVRTKSAEGEATAKGVDFGSASLAKVLRHLNTPKREAALLSAAWAMASAVAMK